MGAQQSSPVADDAKVFTPPKPSITLAPELLDQLSDKNFSPTPSSSRQASLDESIRSKLSSSLASLKEEEQRLTTELEAALKGAQKAGEMDPSGGAKGASSLALKREIEEIREKVQRMSEKRQLSDWPDVAAKKAAVKECYLSNADRPLDCWRQAEEFKTAVAKLEQHFVSTLR